MKAGLLASNHIAVSAIAATCQASRHEVRELDPGDLASAQLRGLDAIIVASGDEQPYRYVYTRDLAAAVMAVFDHPGWLSTRQ